MYLHLPCWKPIWQYVSAAGSVDLGAHRLTPNHNSKILDHLGTLVFPSTRMRHLASNLWLNTGWKAFSPVHGSPLRNNISRPADCLLKFSLALFGVVFSGRCDQCKLTAVDDDVVGRRRPVLRTVSQNVHY